MCRKFFFVPAIALILALSASPISSLKSHQAHRSFEPSVSERSSPAHGRGLAASAVSSGWAKTYGRFFPGLGAGYSEDDGCMAPSEGRPSVNYCTE